jgi:acetolactate synthase I/II/III large subunit
VKPLVGIGGDSGDLSFPVLKKIAEAYGYPHFEIRNNSEMEVLDKVLKTDGAVICEIFVSKEQLFEPKAASRRLDDGTLVSAPLEDLAPFLPADELAENMFIPTVDK